jgi:hypothetical protein
MMTMTPDEPTEPYTTRGMRDCPVHVDGACIPDIETLEYDSDYDLYLQRCAYTGRTWWAENNDETWK